MLTSLCYVIFLALSHHSGLTIVSVLIKKKNNDDLHHLCLIPSIWVGFNVYLEYKHGGTVMQNGPTSGPAQDSLGIVILFIFFP